MRTLDRISICLLFDFFTSRWLLLYKNFYALFFSFFIFIYELLHGKPHKIEHFFFLLVMSFVLSLFVCFWFLYYRIQLLCAVGVKTCSVGKIKWQQQSTQRPTQNTSIGRYCWQCDDIVLITFVSNIQKHQLINF